MGDVNKSIQEYLVRAIDDDILLCRMLMCFVTLVDKLVIPQFLVLLALQLALYRLRHLLDVVRTRQLLDLRLVKVEAPDSM